MRCSFQGQSFVAKRVSHSFFQLSQEQKKEFPHSQHVRMHVDYNEKEIVLVYDYYKHTFLALLSQHPEFPPAEIKKILRCTAEDAKDLLDKDWNISVSHSPHFAPLKQITNPSDFEDVKPDNILVDWEYDAQGEPKVDKVALGDFDIALKLVDEQPLRASHAVGNVMWRSPEGQSGKSLAKASDIYSLGLVVSDSGRPSNCVPKIPLDLTFENLLKCIYGLGGGSMLILDDDTIKQLKENGMPPEQEIVVRHFMYFGPLPDGLLKHVDDEKWTILFRAASEIAETEAAEDPDCRFERWPVDHAPHLTQEAKNIITNMTRLDLAQRANIDEALKHPWWRLAEPS